MVCSHPLDTLILPRCMPSEEVLQAQLEFVKILAFLLQSTDLNYAIFQILCSQFCPLNTRKSDGERSNQGSPQTASELGIEMAKEFTNLGVWGVQRTAVLASAVSFCPINSVSPKAAPWTTPPRLLHLLSWPRGICLGKFLQASLHAWLLLHSFLCVYIYSLFTPQIYIEHLYEVELSHCSYRVYILMEMTDNTQGDTMLP